MRTRSSSNVGQTSSSSSSSSSSSTPASSTSSSSSRSHSRTRRTTSRAPRMQLATMQARRGRPIARMSATIRTSSTSRPSPSSMSAAVPSLSSAFFPYLHAIQIRGMGGMHQRPDLQLDVGGSDDDEDYVDEEPYDDDDEEDEYKHYDDMLTTYEDHIFHNHLQHHHHQHHTMHMSHLPSHIHHTLPLSRWDPTYQHPSTRKRHRSSTQSSYAQQLLSRPSDDLSHDMNADGITCEQLKLLMDAAAEEEKEKENKKQKVKRKKGKKGSTLDTEMTDVDPTPSTSTSTSTKSFTLPLSSSTKHARSVRFTLSTTASEQLCDLFSSTSALGDSFIQPQQHPSYTSHLIDMTPLRPIITSTSMSHIHTPIINGVKTWLASLNYHTIHAWWRAYTAIMLCDTKREKTKSTTSISTSTSTSSDQPSKTSSKKPLSKTSSSISSSTSTSTSHPISSTIIIDDNADDDIEILDIPPSSTRRSTSHTSHKARGRRHAISRPATPPIIESIYPHDIRIPHTYPSTLPTLVSLIHTAYFPWARTDMICTCSIHEHGQMEHITTSSSSSSSSSSTSIDALSYMSSTLIQQIHEHMTWSQSEDTSITTSPIQHANHILTSSIRIVRCFLILIELPIWDDPTNHPTFGRLLVAITTLPPILRAMMVTHIATYPTSVLSTIVERIQTFLAASLYSSYITDDTIRASCRMLSLLYESHIYAYHHIPGYTLISQQEWYNEAVNKVGDLHKDYMQWCDDAYTTEISSYEHQHKRSRKSTSTSTDDIDTIMNIWERMNHIFTFCSYPFLLQPVKKAELMHHEAMREQTLQMEQAVYRTLMDAIPPAKFLILTVRRRHIVQDTVLILSRRANDAELKKPLKVIFAGEEGIDAGGVRKEFFQLLIRSLFDPMYGMFLYDDDTRVYTFNPHCGVLTTDDDEKTSINPEVVVEYELVGMLLGLAIYNMIILDIHFPLSIYRKLLGEKLTYTDLCHAFPQLGRGLQSLLDYTGDDIEETFALTFSLDEMVFGTMRTIDLIPGGRHINVTQENKHDYVTAYTNYILNNSISQQFDAFARGFYKLCNPKPLDLFSADDLELLICGNPILDFHQLEQVTLYEGFHEHHSGFDPSNPRGRPSLPLIDDLWSILHNLSLDEQKKFLFFVTGSDRVPINGLQDLKFIIQNGGTNQAVLPSAHTCFNTFVLPMYCSKQMLQTKLLIAINNAEGFGMR